MKKKHGTGKNKYLRYGSRSTDAKLPKSLAPQKKAFTEKDLEEFKELGWNPPSLDHLNRKPSQKWNKQKKKRK